MSLKRAENFISEEEYHQGEQEAETRHELINGEVYAMAGTNENHNLVSGNVFSELKNRLKGSSCKIFMSDMKVKAGGDFFTRMSWSFAKKTANMNTTKARRS